MHVFGRITIKSTRYNSFHTTITQKVPNYSPTSTTLRSIHTPNRNRYIYSPQYIRKLSTTYPHDRPLPLPSTLSEALYKLSQKTANVISYPSPRWFNLLDHSSINLRGYDGLNHSTILQYLWAECRGIQNERERETIRNRIGELRRIAAW